MKKLEEYVEAAELAEQNSPEVKYFAYCYKDTALNKYNPPFYSDKDPGFMVDALKNAVIKGEADVRRLVGFDFCFVGTFELSTGTSEVFPTPKHIVLLNDLFERYGGQDGKVA